MSNPYQITHERKGFTLIELLIVLAIIGILMAIAVPTYIGQREKARISAVEAGAKGAESDMLADLDCYVSGEPFVKLNASGVETCYQSDDALTTGKTCLSVYSDISTIVNYPHYPGGMANILNAIYDHHAGKGEKSPLGTGSLFENRTTPSALGKVIFFSNSSRSITIEAYGNITSIPMWSTTIFAW